MESFDIPESNEIGERLGLAIRVKLRAPGGFCYEPPPYESNGRRVHFDLADHDTERLAAITENLTLATERPWLQNAAKHVRKRPRVSAGNSHGELSLSEAVRMKAPMVGDLMMFVRRFVVMSEGKLLVVALWIIHTYGIKAFQQTPYLSVTSPERECGKSRLLEVLELLVANPWMITQPSEAVVFRQVHAKTPTLLLDEIDTIFSPKTAQYHEGLRGILDQGHRRHGKVPRFIGDKVREFNVYCAKVLAGIGTLPDTIAGRSIPLRLERRGPGEEVESFIVRDVKPVAVALSDRIEAWIGEHLDELSEARPTMPEEISDRMQEGCEPLAAIADHLGCGQEARAALVELLTGERLDEQETMRLRLLRDLKEIFESRDKPGKPCRSIRSPQLLTELQMLDESPWATYYGRGLDAKDLAALLRHYGVRSKAIKFKGGEVHKGYRRDDLYAVWERYLR